MCGSELPSEEGGNCGEVFCPDRYLRPFRQTVYGNLIKTSYYSKLCKRQQPVNILLPAGYNEQKKYPVLYILHGIMEDQNTLVGNEEKGCMITLGNMMADGSAKEMIVVFPYEYVSSKRERCTAIDAENAEVYNHFIEDLQADLMPFLKEKYSIAEGRENTAIIGFSMGGRQAMAIALKMQETFGYVGAISPAPGLVPGRDWAMEHPGQFEEDQLRFSMKKPFLFMICCGDQDRVVGRFPKTYHEIFERNGEKHIWWEIPGSDHGDPAISSGIYHFCRKVFRETA